METPNTPRADLAAVRRFVDERRPLNARWTANQQAIWAAVKRDGWHHSTIAAAFVAVRALHEQEGAA